MSSERYVTRAEDGPPDVPEGAVPLHHLTTQQRAVLTLIDQYERGAGEPCSANWLARRLKLHHETVRQHLFALYRKGWLCAPNSPSSIRGTAEAAVPNTLRVSAHP